MDTVFVKFIKTCEKRESCIGCPYNANNSEFAYVENIDICLALYIYENYDLIPKEEKEELTQEVKQEFIDDAYDSGKEETKEDKSE